MGTITNLVEVEGHDFLLSEISHIGPIFRDREPDINKDLFIVSLRSGASFYLGASQRNNLMHRWLEWIGDTSRQTALANYYKNCHSQYEED